MRRSMLASAQARRAVTCKAAVLVAWATHSRGRAARRAAVACALSARATAILHETFHKCAQRRCATMMVYRNFKTLA